ncbi:MAG TPA: ribulokinase [Verrucomicrobiales bacterium]|nr:ribulokinase [Verrucomicrobiales bacterium]
MGRCAIGLDYGTNSCRSLLVDLDEGRELASRVFPYPSGEAGVLLDPSNPNVARQNPQDYLAGLAETVNGALADARAADPGFSASDIVGIGVDTTGSTPLPVDRQGTPLAFDPRFRDRLAAQVWLWKDHTAHAEAEEITRLAAGQRPHYLAKCGGIYSSEWWWSKILHLKRTDPEVFHAAHSFVEHCDYIPAVLTGARSPESIRRSRCAAGHKAMFHPGWGGLPDHDFLSRLDPDLASLRDRLFNEAFSADQPAGTLTKSWAESLGLPTETAVAVGAFDAHMGAVGAGIREGVLVKILGTSTCDLMVVPHDQPLADIPGLCGIVDGSVLPNHYGLEAGQSAVGDIFLWFVHHLVPGSYGRTTEEKFNALENSLARLRPGESGLLALDWNNGNRTILVDARLTGLILGQTLHTEAHEIYRALIESTAFGALRIIEQIEDYGVPVREVINTGGLAVKSPVLMQIYADVLGRPLKVAASDQTCALGAALFGAAASGRMTLDEARERNCRVRPLQYQPDPANHAIYMEIYGLYRQLHDVFGTPRIQVNLHHVMKRLLNLRDEVRTKH